MSLSLKDLRNAIASQILTIADTQQSPHPPDYFGRTQSTIAHKSFTVGLGVVIGMNERQRQSVGVYVRTSVTVTFAYRLRPLDVYPTDYNNALALESEIIQKVLSDYSAINGKVQIRFESSDRNATASNEYSLHRLEFSVLHTL